MITTERVKQITATDFKQTVSTEDIISAFQEDGYKVVKQVSFAGARGLIAESLTGDNYETGEKKVSYYVEGSSYQMGYLLGLMAPVNIERMANDYIYNFIPCLINPNIDPLKRRSLWKVIWSFITYKAFQLRKKYPNDIPQQYSDEMRGMVEGAKDANVNSSVTFRKLWNLNTAIDVIASFFYTDYGLQDVKKYMRKQLCEFRTSMLAMPSMCNGFVVFGEGTRNGKDHFFGRDFMLTAANVLQYTAAMIIYNPTDRFENHEPIPFCSMAAPGFVGSLTAMNNHGIGIGVNSLPSANSSFSRPGFNSILLIRHCAQYAASAEEGVSLIRNAQRGVSWLYIIGDGKNDKAAVVEAGKKQKEIAFLSYPPDHLKHLLPDQVFLNTHKSSTPQIEGMMVRWSDSAFSVEYLNFNKRLFNYFNKPYNDDQFRESGFLDGVSTETNCPDAYYFSPLRETGKNLIIATNTYLIPEMKMCMMRKALVDKIKDRPAGIKIAKNTYDDIQWRYDVLNKMLLDSYGDIDFDRAQEIISLLKPEGIYPEYYTKNPKSSDGKTKSIEGTISVCDLKNKIMRSHFGYYADEWMQITLPNYL